VKILEYLFVSAKITRIVQIINMMSFEGKPSCDCFIDFIIISLNTEENEWTAQIMKMFKNLKTKLEFSNWVFVHTKKFRFNGPGCETTGPGCERTGPGCGNTGPCCGSTGLWMWIYWSLDVSNCTGHF
jgi:hypothetical protein